MLLVGSARAEFTSDNPAGLLVYPKLLVDDSRGIDTILQLTNTSSDATRVRCYLVNANSHCSNDPTSTCTSNSDCASGAALCLPGWQETDFRFTLTRNQPIVWKLSDGLLRFPLDGLTHITQDGSFNSDSSIPPAPENPFIGEMKCFEVDENDDPTTRNDLKGEVTIVRSTSDDIDARKYNAVGMKSTGVNDGNDTLCIGGTRSTDDCPEPEYNGCPNVLILDHFFDNAVDPQDGHTITTDLTLVPCSEDFLTQTTFKTTVQFLVFNEFEQRLSTSRRITCFEEIQLSDIDTRPPDQAMDNASSIFNIAVNGTLSGQTRIRGVQTNETSIGHGLVGVAEEFHGSRSAAFNLHYAGIRDQGDVIRGPRE
jgi:hypothetical protein